MGLIVWYIELFGRFGAWGLEVAISALFFGAVLVWFIGRVLFDELRLRVWQVFHWQEVLEKRRWEKEHLQDRQ